MSDASSYWRWNHIVVMWCQIASSYWQWNHIVVMWWQTASSYWRWNHIVAMWWLTASSYWRWNHIVVMWWQTASSYWRWKHIVIMWWQTASSYWRWNHIVVMWWQTASSYWQWNHIVVMWCQKCSVISRNSQQTHRIGYCDVRQVVSQVWAVCEDCVMWAQKLRGRRCSPAPKASTVTVKAVLMAMQTSPSSHTITPWLWLLSVHSVSEKFSSLSITSFITSMPVSNVRYAHEIHCSPATEKKRNKSIITLDTKDATFIYYVYIWTKLFYDTGDLMKRITHGQRFANSNVYSIDLIIRLYVF